MDIIKEEAMKKLNASELLTRNLSELNFYLQKRITRLARQNLPKLKWPTV